MKIARTALAGLILTLGACGSSGDMSGKVDEPPKREKADVPVSMKERDPEAYRRNVGSAMADLPEDRRQDFQKLMVCTIKKGTAEGKPVIVDSNLSRSLIEKLRSDPNAMLGCE